MIRVKPEKWAGTPCEGCCVGTAPGDTMPVHRISIDKKDIIAMRFPDVEFNLCEWCVQKLREKLPNPRVLISEYWLLRSNDDPSRYLVYDQFGRRDGVP